MEQDAEDLLHESVIVVGLRDVEHNLVSHVERLGRLGGLGPPDQHRGCPHRLVGDDSALIANRVGEAGRLLPSADVKDDPRLLELQTAPRDRIALEPGAVVPAGAQSELAELVRHVLRGQVEASTGRVTPHHRVVRHDADAVGHVRGRDRRRGLRQGAAVWAGKGPR